MYEVHADFPSPPDTARLWRYMDLSRFLCLLHRRALYFCRRDELHDPWEGALSAGVVGQIRSVVGEDGLSGVAGLYGLVAAQAVLNCWHENDCESVAMWRLYTSGNDGVAMYTTFARLKEALSGSIYSINIARVVYADHERDMAKEAASASSVEALNTMGPILQKRRSYAHESEVRAIIPFPDAPALERYAAMENPPLGTTILVARRERELGLHVPVDPTVLIEGIVLSPNYPPWAIEALQSAIDQAGLPVHIQTSDLLKKPLPATELGQPS